MKRVSLHEWLHVLTKHASICVVWLDSYHLLITKWPCQQRGAGRGSARQDNVCVTLNGHAYLHCANALALHCVQFCRVIGSGQTNCLHTMLQHTYHHHHHHQQQQQQQESRLAPDRLLHSPNQLSYCSRTHRLAAHCKPQHSPLQLLQQNTGSTPAADIWGQLHFMTCHLRQLQQKAEEHASWLSCSQPSLPAAPHYTQKQKGKGPLP